MTRLFKHFFNHFSPSPKNDILSGLTVALALVPEAVAFAFVAGVDPMVGLYGAFFMGLIASLFGGRPGMISGATGSTAVVMVHLVQTGNSVGETLAQPQTQLGVQWLFLTLILAGGLQLLAGFFKLGKFVRLIPHPVMLGFVNGLAIVIFLSQLNLFSEKVAGQRQWLQGLEMATMLGLVALTMFMMWGLPKLTQKIPGALFAIIAVALLTWSFGIHVPTVGTFISQGGGHGLQGSLPHFQTQLFHLLPSLAGHWGLLLSTALVIAAVGLIESLMTLNLIDEITETRGSGNRECLAQGGGNILSGFFGGMGGCAMIGQSMINVESGGRGRLSGVTAAMALLAFILVGAPVIERIPIAALVGVMFMVVIGTFAWSSLRILRKIPLADAFVLIVVSGITVWKDLAVAVLSGVIISALVFAWKNATMIRARKRMKEDGTKVYEIWGPLFFGSVRNFQSKFIPAEDPDRIEIDFIESRVSDHSGVEAISLLARKYTGLGKSVRLTHLSPECQTLLLKADLGFANMIEKAIDDPRYYVVTDLLDQEA